MNIPNGAINVTLSPLSSPDVMGSEFRQWVDCSLPHPACGWETQLEEVTRSVRWASCYVYLVHCKLSYVSFKSEVISYNTEHYTCFSCQKHIELITYSMLTFFTDNHMSKVKFNLEDNHVKGKVILTFQTDISHRSCYRQPKHVKGHGDLIHSQKRSTVIFQLTMNMYLISK